MIKSPRYIPEGCVLDLAMGHGSPAHRRGTIVDRSGKNHNMTVYECPAIDFDGVGDILDTAYIDLGASYTIEGWFYCGANTGGEYIFYNYDGGTTGCQLAISGTYSLSFHPTYSSSEYYTAANALTQNEWNHIAITWSGSVATLKINEATVSLGIQAAGSLWADTGFYLGAYMDTTVKGAVTGRMAAWGIHSGVTPLHNWYDFPQPADVSGYIAFWRMNEGTGVTIDNAETTASRDLSITGASWDFGANLGDSHFDASGAGDQYSDGGRWFPDGKGLLAVADHADFQFTSGGNDLPFSWWAWVKVTNNVDAVAFLNKYNIGGKFNFNAITTSGKIVWRLFNPTNFGARIGIIGTTTVGDNTIRLVGGTYSGSETEAGLKIWINGVEDAVSASGSAGSYTGQGITSLPLHFRTAYSGGIPASQAPCTAYNVGLVSRVLGAADWKALYDAGPRR